MATLYIKYAKKCEKNFFFQIINGNDLFWEGGGYANSIFYLVKKVYILWSEVGRD